LSLCALGQGSLYAVGGRNAQGWTGAEDYAYDVANDTWRVVAPMRTAREIYGACSHGGHLYVVGGWDNNVQWSSCECYDPVSNTWSAIAPLPGAHGRHFGMCSLGEFLYVAGGYDRLSSCFRYHPASNTWNPIAALCTNRLAPCLCALGAFLYAISGSKCQTGQPLSSVERYDPSTNSWSAVAALNVPRPRASCVVFDGRLHVLGGTTDTSDTTTDATAQSVERYDATADAWEVVPAMGLPSARRLMGGCSMLVQMNLFDKLLLERGRS
jgi:N-acetylneuraminic acid mutarotase